VLIPATGTVSDVIIIVNKLSQSEENSLQFDACKKITQCKISTKLIKHDSCIALITDRQTKACLVHFIHSYSHHLVLLVTTVL